MHSQTNIFTYLILIPNQITAIRFMMVPTIWWMIITGLSGYIGIVLIVCLISDALDGYMARRLNQVTDFGGKFDSLADNILILSALTWILMLKPMVLADHYMLCLLAICTYITSLAVGWIKFRQVGNLHLYLSKLSGLVQYVFIIHTFSSATYSPWLFYLAISIFFLSSLETLLLQLIVREVNGHMRSIIFTGTWHSSGQKELRFISKST